MTGQQHAIMWMGLILIILRMFTTVQWSELKSVFGASGGVTGAQPAKAKPGSSILQGIVAPGLDILKPIGSLVSPLIGAVVPGATPHG